jgi:hypothetical protein
MGKTKGYSEDVYQRTDKTMGTTKGYSEVVNQRTDKTMGTTKGYSEDPFVLPIVLSVL